MKHLIKLFTLALFAGCSISESALIEEPKQNKNNIYIKHYAYSLVYNEQHKQADWVAYKLNNYQMVSKYKRTNRFIVDTLIHSGTATNSDYAKSGYDRGHLAPAADMTWDKQAMYESFYYSNITPQLPQFNRGIWKKLESKVRHWATQYDSIYVCTGPVFTNTTKHIGVNYVTIPSHFYKSIVIYNDTIKQGIGFVFPHKKCKDNIFNYAVTIDSIEQLINHNLYYTLPNRHEKKIEREFEIDYWKEK